MISILGWVGSILLSFCAVPEAYRAITSKEYTISIPFVLMWFFGEVFVLVPVLLVIKEPYLILNYVANIIFILVILGRIMYDKFRR